MIKISRRKFIQTTAIVAGFGVSLPAIGRPVFPEAEELDRGFLSKLDAFYKSERRWLDLLDEVNNIEYGTDAKILGLLTDHDKATIAEKNAEADKIMVTLEPQEDYLLNYEVSTIQGLRAKTGFFVHYYDPREIDHKALDIALADATRVAGVSV